MMIETIFGLTIYIEGKARVIDYETIYRITSKEITSIKILFPNDVAFFWPNREGELMQSSNIKEVLLRENLDSASICYPSTASMLFFIFYNSNTKKGTVLHANPDLKGRIALFSLNLEGSDLYLTIETSRIDMTIKMYAGSSTDEIFEKFLSDQKPKVILPQRTRRSRYQVQLGFFSPYGTTAIPNTKGFEVCVDVAKLMNEYIGANNILHLFAYHGAHDANYPEYFPSPQLGGMEGMKKAIENVHREKQLVSIYMNARLFSVNLLDTYVFLKKSIMVDSKGEYIIESYYDRDFYVMDPLSAQWRSVLIERAAFLKSLGADIIQLDQIAGRAAVGPVGYEWGKGYRQLIQEIEKLDLEVWIQGINEIYPVHRFELSYRYPKFLENGTIRGGHPFGVSYPLIPRLLDTQNFLIPLRSEEIIKCIKTENVTIDLEHLPGELSLYSAHYMENLISNLSAHTYTIRT